MYCLLKWIKFSVKKTNTKEILENWKKILEKSGKSQGILSVRKSGNPGDAMNRPVNKYSSHLLQGRNNMFQAILLFLHHVIVKHHGMLG